jgi:hypothetical protein
MGLNINQEDETVINLKISADLTYLIRKDLLILLSEYDLNSTQNVKLVNAGFTHLRYRFNRESNLQPELFIQFQWNGIRGMKSRFLAGENLRFLLNKDSLNISYFALGLMYELETWDYRGVPANESPFNPQDVHTNYIKLNFYYNIDWKIRENVDFSFIVYIQSKPNADIIYPRISPSAQLNFGISEKLSFSFIMNAQYDRKPVVPIRNFYYNLSSAITFKL